MNLAECKKKALSLMAEYSVDGSPIPDSDNADYLNRMNRFASDAQFEIASQIGIDASYTIVQVADTTSGYNRYSVPTDFKELKNIYRNDELFLDFRFLYGRLLMPKSYSGMFEVFYDKNPKELSSDASDSYEFEVAKHAHSVIPYFVAGMAITDENQSLSDKLLNLYYSKLSALKPTNDTTYQTISDVYGW